jgi:hypothetical protein
MSHRVSVLVSDSGMKAFEHVVDACKKAGLHVEHALKSTGVITGSVESTKLAALNKVSGVDAVETERNVQLPPPGSEVQ